VAGRKHSNMPPIIIIDTNVLVAGLRSSRGASHALLQAVGRGDFTIGLTATLVRDMDEGAPRYGVELLTPAQALARLEVGE
jgi:predicted nucleic acid-binding protein